MNNVTDRKALVIWFTGLSGAGKTTLCGTVGAELKSQGLAVQVLDGDEVRRDICSDLGFSESDRKENIRRITYVADLLIRHSVIVLVAAISPLRVMRTQARRKLGYMLEVFVNAPVAVCEARDPKGLYRRARARDLQNFTGIDAEYEPPLAPDVICHTNLETIPESTEKVLSAALNMLHETRMQQCSTLGSEAGSKRRTVAVDLDGVIAEHSGWQGRDAIGDPRSDVLAALRTLRAEGWKIIVHTTRCKHDVIDYLRRASIPFDEINQNSDRPTLGAKPYANIYWDDRAVRYSGNAEKDIQIIRSFRTWAGRA